jgi:hypothetical protein
MDLWMNEFHSIRGARSLASRDILEHFSWIMISSSVSLDVSVPIDDLVSVRHST